MPTLSTILPEKKEDILKLMSQFNFKADSAQILCHVHPEELLTNSESDEFPHTLYFVVDGDKQEDRYNDESVEQSSNYLSLEVFLSEKLNCDVGILLLKDLQKGIYWQTLLEYCAPISDEDKIAELFKVTSLNNVQIDELNKEDKHFQHRQKLAHRIPQTTDDKKISSETAPSSPHSMFKRKRSDADEFGYSPSPASTTDSESEQDELFVNEKMAELTKHKNLSVNTIDMFIEQFQKLKQKKLASSDEESELDTKKQHTNKI